MQYTQVMKKRNDILVLMILTQNDKILKYKYRDSAGFSKLINSTQTFMNHSKENHIYVPVPSQDLDFQPHITWSLCVQ